MRHIASLLVLGVLLAPGAPFSAAAQDLVEVPETIEETVEEVVEEVEELVEDVPEEVIEEPLEGVIEEEEPKRGELEELLFEGESFAPFSLLSAPEEELGTVVYDFPTSVWGNPNGAFSGGSALTPYPPFGTTDEDMTGAWDDVSAIFTRWYDTDTEYTFDTLETYLTVTGLSGLSEHPLTAGSVQVKIYAADGSWNKGEEIAASELLPATSLAQAQTSAHCTGDGTAANPYSNDCIAAFTFTSSVTLAAGERYVFELSGTDIKSPTRFFNLKYFYPGLSMVGASTSVSPFGNDGIQDAPNNNTGAVYLRLSLGEPELPTVLFLPGFLASRLHAPDGSQLWEPNGDADFEALAFEGGVSKTDIYVGDVINRIRPESPVTLELDPVHEALLAWLEELSAAAHIADWEAYSYDWRYDVRDVIADGTLREDGSRDYLVDVANELGQEGPITIIAHSNGGLLAKALMIRLAELGQEDLVNRIILIGVPQVGTPQAALGLLHGDNVARPFWTPRGTARAAAATMPGAYALLPSEAYFDGPHSVLAAFDTGSVTDAYIASYGELLLDLAHTLAFWKNDPNVRDVPEENDEETPLPLSPDLIAKAQETHDVLDAWVPPDGIEVHEIAAWGNDTATGAIYLTECPLFICSIDYERHIAADGDDTVLAPSALYMGAGVYFDLFELEDDFSEESKHQNLTESSFLHDYLEYLLGLGTAFESALFVSTEPSTDKFPSTRTRVLSVHSPVILSIRDSHGNESGIFPVPESDLYYLLEEIPDSSVDISGEDKYVTLPAEGTYDVVVTGIGSGTYTFKMQEYENGELLSDSSITGIPATNGSSAFTTVTETEEVPAPLGVDKNGDGITETSIAFHKNATVVYEEPIPAEEDEEGGNTKRSGSSNTNNSEQESTPAQKVELWPNPYLLPPSPFIPVNQQEQSLEEPSTETQAAEEGEYVPAPQTASVYDAIQAILDWLKKVLGSFFAWILGLVT